LNEESAGSRKGAKAQSRKAFSLPGRAFIRRDLLNKVVQAFIDWRQSTMIDVGQYPQSATRRMNASTSRELTSDN
jgi:hypothetical protein